MLKKLIKKIIPSRFKHSISNVQFEQEYWDNQYSNGKWQYLDKLNELAHYSVIVGYCQHFSPDGSLLDVGCGEAVLQQRLNILPYTQYTGIDISENAISVAEHFNNDKTEFFATDAATYKNDKLYDVIIFNESLYCFNNCVDILKHYEALLNPGGVFVISMHIQEVSLAHWEKIDSNYQILDSIKLTNNEDISWQCKVVKP